MPEAWVTEIEVTYAKGTMLEGQRLLCLKP